MAEALIQLVNQNVDIDGLTANEADVFDGATFIGQGSETVRKGTGVTQGAPTLGLSLNGRVTIPAGKYTGGKVQQSIQVLGEQRINPTSKNIKIPTKDMYMAGNIIVASIPNLKPENIKKGEYVGGVGPGTWEGYIRAPASFTIAVLLPQDNLSWRLNILGHRISCPLISGKRQWSFTEMKIPEGNIMFSCLILRLTLPQKAN